MQRVSETGKCLLSWRSDGTVTKELVPGKPLAHEIRDRFAYETRINTLLAEHPPPVPFARLLAIEGEGRMRFEVVDGQPYGPKFAESLPRESITALLALSNNLEEYRPAAEWIRRYDPAHELQARRHEGVIDPDEFHCVAAVLAAREWPPSFAHGDLTPRNVLGSPNGPVLIDWEFAGWHPLEYDRAFLWFVLSDLPDERAYVESTVRAERRASFWLSAYLILLLHLGMWARRGVQSSFQAAHIAAHRACLDELLRVSAS